MFKQGDNLHPRDRGIGTADGSYDVNADTFAISAPLTAGSYWFQLDAAVASDSSNVYWDLNGGPSTAYQSSNGQIASQAFELDGGSVPEPTTLGLLGAGMAGIFIARRRRLA